MKRSFLSVILAFGCVHVATSQRVLDAVASISSVDERQIFYKVDTGDFATDKGCSRGVAWGDLNSDTLPDAVVVNCNNQNVFLYINGGNGYMKRQTEGTVAENTGYIESVSLIDYDNDRDLDIFLTTLNNHPDQLFKNDGKANFTLVQAGDLTRDSSSAPGSCWCDYDNDGDLDVYLATSGTADDVLYKNNGKQIFERVPNSRFPYAGGDGRTCSWGDIDGDGDFDLYVGNFMETINGVRSAAQNYLYINNGGGRLSRVIKGDAVTDRGRTYGTSFSDFDNDGDADLMVTNIGRRDSSVLYRNNDGGRFTRLLPAESGIVNGKPSKGHTWGDFNNDGWVDLFVANGTENIPDSLLTEDLYFGSSDGKLVKVNMDALSREPQVSAGTAFADVDVDGDLDLFVCNWKNNNERNAWYINRSNNSRSINIRLTGAVSNFMGMGAKVQLMGQVKQQPFIQTRWMFPQTGFASQNENIIHFGLPANFIFKSLAIVWPSGRKQEISQLSFNTQIHVVEPGE